MARYNSYRTSVFLLFGAIKVNTIYWQWISHCRVPFCHTPHWLLSFFGMVRSFTLALLAMVALSARANSKPSRAAAAVKQMHSETIGKHNLASSRTANPSATTNNPRHVLRKWRSTLFARTMDMYKQLEFAKAALIEPQGGRRFDLFDPFLTCPDGRPPIRFGKSGEGGKLLCSDVLAARDCVVYSLGSNGDFSFEEDVLARTTCTVVTFDCTSVARSVGARHKFVGKCLGSEMRMAADPASWITLEAAMESMGHVKLSLLKIDVEGAEFDVLSAWALDSLSLPRHIAMELHYDDLYWGTPAARNSSDISNLIWPLHKMRLADLALFMSHVSGAGYGIVSREDNDASPHCSELTLLRVRQ